MRPVYLLDTNVISEFTTTQDNQDFTANILPLIFKCFGKDYPSTISSTKG